MLSLYEINFRNVDYFSNPNLSDVRFQNTPGLPCENNKHFNDAASKGSPVDEREMEYKINTKLVKIPTKTCCKD